MASTHDVSLLREAVEVEWLRAQLSAYSCGDADQDLTNSIRMWAVNQMIDRVAASDVTVLVLGESGVGKQLVARALHQRSPRRARPFVKVNCAALPLELLESELFGYEPGAFTGAHRQKPGKFELADGGTIFLDEIGELPLPLQAKLLQVLQDQEFSRLGGRHDIRVNARILAATNKDLDTLIHRGEFREDLYYRLNVVNIHVPPLRDRPEEIPILVDHLLGRYAQQYARRRPSISPDTMSRFMKYTWPGNIREVENIVKRIVVFGTDEWVARELGFESAPPPAAPSPDPPNPGSHRTDNMRLKDLTRRAADEVEREVLKHVLQQVRWNRVEAARRLQISYKAMLNKIQRHNLVVLLALLYP
jgi:two-component system response regulator AtoC